MVLLLSIFFYLMFDRPSWIIYHRTVSMAIRADLAWRTFPLSCLLLSLTNVVAWGLDATCDGNPCALSGPYAPTYDRSWSIVKADYVCILTEVYLPYQWWLIISERTVKTHSHNHNSIRRKVDFLKSYEKCSQQEDLKSKWSTTRKSSRIIRTSKYKPGKKLLNYLIIK